MRTLCEGLVAGGCRLLFVSDPGTAPFRITFEAPDGERQGIVAYAFLSTRTPTKNRPDDERSFQIKYGSKAHGETYPLWQDPLGLHTTLLLGVDPGAGLIVSADPVLHSPTKFFIRFEFKDEHAEAIDASGWHSWERSSRTVGNLLPIETVVGCRVDRLLDLVRFERDALGEDQGHRGMLADRWATGSEGAGLLVGGGREPNTTQLHRLAAEFDLSEREVLDLIGRTPRMKMAVRGGVAELHLARLLAGVPGVADCHVPEGDGQPDLSLRYRGSDPFRVECKNCLRKTNKAGLIRVDFQRTRASKADPCSRYYSPLDFDALAACTHAVTDSWDFRFHDTRRLTAHAKCPGKLGSNLLVEEGWPSDPETFLAQLARDRSVA